MAENPLLPNAKLQQLYATMQRSRTLLRKDPGTLPLEAILASSLLHLGNSDFLSPFPGSNAARKLAVERSGEKPGAPELLTPTRLTTCAGVAMGLKVASESVSPRADSGFCLAQVVAGTTSPRVAPDWAEALLLAHLQQAPLLLLCAATDAPARGTPARGMLSWTNVNRVARPLKLPVLPVDGADAVALYRVLQESVLRARHGGGPSVLWCVLPARPQASDDAVRKLRAYMKTRSIPLSAAR